MRKFLLFFCVIALSLITLVNTRASEKDDSTFECTTFSLEDDQVSIVNSSDSSMLRTNWYNDCEDYNTILLIGGTTIPFNVGFHLTYYNVVLNNASSSSNVCFTIREKDSSGQQVAGRTFNLYLNAHEIRDTTFYNVGAGTTRIDVHVPGSTYGSVCINGHN